MAERMIDIPPLTPEMARLLIRIVQEANVPGRHAGDAFITMLALEEIATGRVICSRAEAELQKS